MPPAEKLVTLADPRSPAAEAFRTLRANLMFSSVDRPLASLLVTAPAAEAEQSLGKSLTLANLAVSLAQGGRRTLLVDCDLRRPRQHEIFGAPAQPGLTDLVLDPAEAPEPPLVETGVPDLWLLPAGALPPNPADLLTSRRLEAVINHLKSRADIVLFDAPPVVGVSDAILLGSKLDGALLVIGAGRTRREDAQRARAMLEKVGVRVVGAVMTEVE